MTISHEEALLVVQLYRASSDQSVSDAQGFMWSDAFVEDGGEFFMKYPVGSVEAGFIGKIATFNETVGTLWKHGALSLEFLKDWLAVHLVWGRLQSLMLYQREGSGEPRLWENFEALAKAMEA